MYRCWLTLKLEMVFFPASVRDLLTQPTMVSSVTFSPSPSSSRMFRVYLRGNSCQHHRPFQNKVSAPTIVLPVTSS